MAVTIRDVEHIAELARLEFTDAEKETFTRQFNDILAYMEHLGKLDTTQVEPLAQVIERANVFRKDEAATSITNDEALKNAPSSDPPFFTVPKVIGD